MSDFMRWLYANYIKPQIGTPAQGSIYALHMELIQAQLPDEGMEDFEMLLEYTAIRAFLLGMRTGEGLAVSRQ